MTYLVTAFRWGWLNNHSYNVYCGQDFAKAFETAEEEADDRGGKYGVVVYRFDDEEDGTQDQQLIGYFPSSWGEKLPRHNYKLDLNDSLGHMLSDYVEQSDADPELVKKVQARKAFYDELEERINGNY